MKIHELEIFQAVAEEKSFVRASHRMYISQPAVTQCVRKMEEELGFPLFVRDTHSVHLTEQGEIFLNGARRILSLYAETLSECRGASHPLNFRYIANANLHLLPLIVPPFRKRCPGIEVNCSRCPLDEVSRVLEENELLITPRYLAENIPGVHFYPLYVDVHYCTVNRRNPLSEKDCVRYPDLAGQTFLIPPNPPWHMEQAREICASMQCPFGNGRNVDTITMNLLSDENAFAIMPGYTRPEHPDLVSIPFLSDIRIPVGVASKRPLSAEESAFLENAAAVLAAFESPGLPDPDP